MNVFVLFLLFIFPSKILAKIYTEQTSKKLVVFVHGYRGDENSTWTNGDFYWPNELKEDLKVNVYVPKYKTGICAGEKLEIISQNLFKELIERYENNLDDVTFIGYSMGGLILRQMIVDNFSYFKEKFVDKKFLNLILLDTPNLGANIAWFTKNCSKQTRNLEINSSFLDKLNEKWRLKFGQRDSTQFFNYITFYAKDSWVVSKNSAIEFGQKNQATEGGHLSISKPKSKTDPIYLWIKGQILSHDLWSISPKTSDNDDEKLRIRTLNLIRYSREYDPELLDKLIELSLSSSDATVLETSIKKRVSTSMQKFQYMGVNPLDSKQEILFENYRNDSKLKR